MSLYLVTGAIRTGKTTALFKAVQGLTGIAGLLSPVVEDKRFLFDVSARALFPLEASAEDKATVSIGRYTFSRGAFARGTAALRGAMAAQYRTLLLDEAGKLEVAGEGFAEVLPELILYASQPDRRVLVVVREELTEVFKRIYCNTLTDVALITKEDVWDLLQQQ